MNFSETTCNHVERMPCIFQIHIKIIYSNAWVMPLENQFWRRLETACTMAVLANEVIEVSGWDQLGHSLSKRWHVSTETDHDCSL